MEYLDPEIKKTSKESLVHILKRLLKKKHSCPVKCYANAFITLPNETSTVLRTFTQDEINSERRECITVPLTASCSTPLLQIGNCKSPNSAWCRIVDQGNGYITSLQIPKTCCGCYNFDLSASVALNGTFNFTLTDLSPLTIFPLSYIVNIPCKVSLKLSEQLPRIYCVTDEVSATPEQCFTSVTFPIIDTPMATETLPDSIITSLFSLLNAGIATDTLNESNTINSQPITFSNLSVAGTVCLKSCQRLVPTLTVEPINLNELLGLPLTLNGNVITLQSLTNVKLHLASLSLKLTRIGNCKAECDQCKYKQK